MNSLCVIEKKENMLSKMNTTNPIWRWLALVCLCFVAVPAQSQEKKDPPKVQDQDEVVSVKTNLVNIDVIVKDKKGKFVPDLKAADFTVFENGVQQKVEFFEPPLGGSIEGENPKIAQPIPRPDGRNTKESTQPVTGPVEGSGRRNIISLVLDGQTTDQSNLKRVREGMSKYIREQVSETDSVAVFAVTSGLQLFQDFTSDKTKLQSAVARAFDVSTTSKNFEQRDIADNISSLREQVNNSSSAPITTAAGGSAAGQAMIASTILQQYIKLRTALSTQQSRPILAALAAICEGQRAIPGKKTLVLFSQGFVTPAILDWQVQSTIDIANRANVAIYIIDSAGLRGGGTQSGSLVPSAPLAGVSGATSQEQRIRAVGGETIFDTVRYEGLNREYDILYRVSEDTGGRLVKGNNDISQGLERIDQEIRARYTLAYRSTDQNFDGGYRKLKIEVRRPDTQVIARTGYYAIAHEDIIPFSPEEKRLLSEIATAEANPGLPIFVELSPRRSSDGLYTVPVSVEVSPEAVKFERKGEKQYLQVDILGVVRSSPNRVLSRLGGNFDVGLSSAQYQSILSNDIFYRQDLELPPGVYTLGLIIRDRLSGKAAAIEQQLRLPEMDVEFAASPVILSRRLTVSKESASATAAAVVSEGGVGIRPSPSHKFRAGDNLIMFFEVYNAAINAETKTPLVRVTATLMKDEKAVTQPIDYVLTEKVLQPVPHLTFAKYISLAGLAPGTYSVMIESRDMVNRKSITQRVSFVIIQ